MTIIPTQCVRDTTNQDNAIFTIEYDVNGVMQAPITMDYPMVDLDADSLQTIRDNIVAYAKVERGDNLWASVQSKITPYIGQDIE